MKQDQRPRRQALFQIAKVREISLLSLFITSFQSETASFAFLINVRIELNKLRFLISPGNAYTVTSYLRVPVDSQSDPRRNINYARDIDFRILQESIAKIGILAF